MSVYETTRVADFSLTSEQNKLERSAKAYHKSVREIGLVKNESAFDMVAHWFGEEGDDVDAYWRKVGADTEKVHLVRARVAEDVAIVTRRLEAVNEAGADLLVLVAEDKTPSRADITEIENVLISVRHARDAFREALDMANKRDDDPVDVELVLSSLDGRIEMAAQLADKLAAARMSGALSSARTERA